MSTWRILVGDVRETLAQLPAGSVQTCVTSPPYWGLRDYGTATWGGGDPACDHLQPLGDGAEKWNASDTHERPFRTGTQYTHQRVSGNVCGKCGARRIDSQLGLEPTPAEYVANMVAVFAEVWRVLRDDGTLWLNLGDSYAREGGPVTRPGATAQAGNTLAHVSPRGPERAPFGMKQKDLVGVPWSVAFALRDAGWYLRSDIIWAKPNPMPESVTDRPTKSHEYLFLLSKRQTYYYDAAAIAEPLSGTTLDRFGPLPQRTGPNGLDTVARSVGNGRAQTLGCGQDGSRNKRTVWTVATQSYDGAHFATYPEDLITPCILAGTSEKGQCPACGAPWERVVERGDIDPLRGNSTAGPKASTGDKMGRKSAGYTDRGGGWTPGVRHSSTTGWQPSCACNAGDPVPQLVLDPFTGSGTTGAVAIRHQRSFVGCELNPSYVELARKRIGSVAPMFAEEVA